MTPVKSQEQHGSCWAFSNTTSFECDWFIAAGNLLPFSGQQLLGCDTDDSACDGVFVDNGFAFAEKNDLCTEVSYSCIGSSSEVSRDTRTCPLHAWCVDRFTRRVLPSCEVYEKLWI